VVPVFDAKDNTVVIGAIEMMNKKKMKTCDTTTTTTDNDNDNDDESGIVPFNECDEKLLKVLASHVSSFIRVVDSS